jgi:hypothetical protein
MMCDIISAYLYLFIKHGPHLHVSCTIVYYSLKKHTVYAGGAAIFAGGRKVKQYCPLNSNYNN